MPPKSNVPIRICGSKTRSGCKTCKQRHLKCDERQPICLRCERAKRDCAYDVFLSPREKSSSPPKSGPTILFTSKHPGDLKFPSPDRNPSPYGTQELAEVSAVKNFAAFLGKNLAGCYSDQVWCQIAPRTAQYEPSIWHAICATSILDTSIRLRYRGQSGSSLFNIALGHYNKSIRELHQRLKSDRTGCQDVVLLSCVLYTVMDCLQGNIMSSLQHISNGMKLLTEWEREAQCTSHKNTEIYLNRKSLLPIFLSLETQAIQLGVVNFRDSFYSLAFDNQPHIPQSFQSTGEAYFYLNQIFNLISFREQWAEPVTAIGDKPSEEWMMMEKEKQRTHLEKWDAAFETLRDSCYPERKTLLLLVQRNLITAMFQADMRTELSWDNFLSIFEEAITIAEEYMSLTTSNNQYTEASTASISSDLNDSPPTITVAMDIVLPLFVISTKCRDSNIRRRALNLLRICNRKEGIWDSNLCARVSERIIELEEREALENGYIPESARIYILDLSLKEERVANLVHRKRSRDERGHCYDTSFEETLAW